MPKALIESEIDSIAEQIDADMAESGEEAAIPKHRTVAEGHQGDLSDGGQVGSARLTVQGESGRIPYDKKAGFTREPGRPTVRQVWMWNGTPSTIPLAYEPSGKSHDGGRRYLLKRHCTVCNFGGFKGAACPACRKEGREYSPSVPLYYLKRSLVPEQQRFFGEVDCIVPTCVRRGRYGFLDDAQMRQHAMGKHRQEYRAYQDSQQNSQASEIAAMRAQIQALTTAALSRQAAPAPTAAVTATPPVGAKREQTPAQKAYNERLKAEKVARLAAKQPA